jgi:hypothetical protein
VLGTHTRWMAGEDDKLPTAVTTWLRVWWTLECGRACGCVASESSLLGQAVTEHEPLLCPSPCIAMPPARQQCPASTLDHQHVVRRAGWRTAIWSCSREGARAVAISNALEHCIGLGADWGQAVRLQGGRPSLAPEQACVYYYCIVEWCGVVWCSQVEYGCMYNTWTAIGS